jgi:hypothetical protein
LLKQARELNPSLPPPRQVLCLLYATQDRAAEFNAELQGFARLVPAGVPMVQAQAQNFYQMAMQARARGMPFSWQQAMQALAAGAPQQQPPMPYPAPVPHPPGAWGVPGYPPGPGGVADLEQAGEALKAWWQKLTS